jgi:hypothetical protein
VVIDFSILDKNPLDLIVKEKKFAKRLKERGADGTEINKILHNWYGLMMKIPVLKNEAVLKNRNRFKDLSYSMRRIMSVLKDPIILDEIKEVLGSELIRLYREREEMIPEVIKMTMHPEEKETKRRAKSFKQVRGFQVIDLYNYLRPFADKITKQYEGIEQYRQRDIFRLIAELFDVTEIVKQEGPRYGYKDIEILYFNNLP